MPQKQHFFFSAEEFQILFGVHRWAMNFVVARCDESRGLSVIGQVRDPVQGVRRRLFSVCVNWLGHVKNQSRV